MILFKLIRSERNIPIGHSPILCPLSEETLEGIDIVDRGSQPRYEGLDVILRYFGRYRRMKSSSSGTLLWAALHCRSSVFESEMESTSMALGSSQVDPRASHRVYPMHQINATMVWTEILTFILDQSDREMQQLLSKPSCDARKREQS